MRSWLAWSVAACAAVTAVALVALEQSEPARCPEGLVALGARCCGENQTLQNGSCTGSATRCAAGMTLVDQQGERQCQHVVQRVPVAGGRLTISPTDWEAEDIVTPYSATLNAFALDDTEVTWGRYLDCFRQGPCASVTLSTPKPLESGLPLTRVSPEQAQQICVALGGRLPTGDEWVFAAAGANSQRFPWGSTGLVCRRAAFGLVKGPCAQASALPELAGARPDGATELGLQDLAGNVAEWTVEPSGLRARGGSFRSSVAGQLKSWASLSTATPASDIGFRCAYDQR